MGQPVLLTSDEYRGLLSDREEHERKYRRHLERLNSTKKKDPAEVIKTPIPSNPDRCFVCQATINEDYREHVRGDQHRRMVETNDMYSDIDGLLAELNVKKEIDEL
jgi:hypothetical protein